MVIQSRVEPFSLDPYRIKVDTDTSWLMLGPPPEESELEQFPPKELKEESHLREVNLISDYALTTNCFDYLDDMILCCLFKDTVAIDTRVCEYGTGQQIQVKISATVMSTERREFLRTVPESDLDENLDTGYFVGEIRKAPQGSLILEGTQVTSILKCPIVSKYVTLPAESLVAIPEKLDPGEAVTVISTYLPMFAALHYGNHINNKRFSDVALEDKVILIHGANIQEADALVKLARIGGSTKIFVSQPGKTLEKFRSRYSKYLTLLDDDDPADWFQKTSPESVDVIVDLSFPRHFKYVRRLVKEGGRLVCVKPDSSATRTWISNLGHFISEAGMVAIEGATLFDFDEICESQYGEVLADMKFLFGLLSKRRIRPLIDRYIPAERIHNEIRFQPEAAGAIICEPS